MPIHREALSCCCCGRSPVARWPNINIASIRCSLSRPPDSDGENHQAERTETENVRPRSYRVPALTLAPGRLCARLTISLGSPRICVGLLGCDSRAREKMAATQAASMASNLPSQLKRLSASTRNANMLHGEVACSSLPLLAFPNRDVRVVSGDLVEGTHDE